MQGGRGIIYCCTELVDAGWIIYCCIELVDAGGGGGGGGSFTAA